MGWDYWCRRNWFLELQPVRARHEVNKRKRENNSFFLKTAIFFQQIYPDTNSIDYLFEVFFPFAFALLGAALLAKKKNE